ncbi:hypothetical protein FB451DRAFT_1174538 [Mycena latifolia]|nr:hypothetical protein FB451DRAFT_1174538 [Mycena latifolia]
MKRGFKAGPSPEWLFKYKRPGPEPQAPAPCVSHRDHFEFDGDGPDLGNRVIRMIVEVDLADGSKFACAIRTCTNNNISTTPTVRISIPGWLLPLALPVRDGWNVILDTCLGAVHAYGTDGFPPEDTIELRRHDGVPDSDAEREHATWTEYSRAPLVPAVRYLSEVNYAYRSLARLPVIAERRAHVEEPTYPQNYPMWIIRGGGTSGRVLTLSRQCGWPDN